MYEYRARLMTRSGNRHAIYDGDTLWIEVDLGFGHLYRLGPCRLAGIDTPEVNRRASRVAGLSARDALRRMLPRDRWFRVQTEKDAKGKYGRYLVRIFLDDGTNVNDRLVQDGHAVERSY